MSRRREPFHQSMEEGKGKPLTSQTISDGSPSPPSTTGDISTRGGPNEHLRLHKIYKGTGAGCETVDVDGEVGGGFGEARDLRLAAVLPRLPGLERRDCVAAKAAIG